jgi:hypothetical protein
VPLGVKSALAPEVFWDIFPQGMKKIASEGLLNSKFCEKLAI